MLSAIRFGKKEATPDFINIYIGVANLQYLREHVPRWPDRIINNLKRERHHIHINMSLNWLSTGLSWRALTYSSRFRIRVQTSAGLDLNQYVLDLPIWSTERICRKLPRSIQPWSPEGSCFRSILAFGNLAYWANMSQALQADPEFKFKGRRYDIAVDTVSTKPSEYSNIFLRPAATRTKSWPRLFGP